MANYVGALLRDEASALFEDEVSGINNPLTFVQVYRPLKNLIHYLDT